MATLGTIDLGIVKTENSSKDSNLFHYPIPKQDSDSAFLVDRMGVSRTITITGEFVGTPAEIKANISAIESVQNGKQSGSTYNGELLTGRNTQIQSFSWDYVEGTPNRVSYSLTLMEGS